MSIQITNKGIDVSPALRERISDRVADGLHKYFDRPGETFVAIQKDGPGFEVSCSLHLPTGTWLQAKASNPADAYAAADDAVHKLEKRLRRYKRKLRHHDHSRAFGGEKEEALYAILQAGQTPVEVTEEAEAAEAETEAPAAVVVSETASELRTMEVSMAVWEMDITEAQVLLFRNPVNNEVNALYRRPDGHIGWINPKAAKADA